MKEINVCKELQRLAQHLIKIYPKVLDTAKIPKKRIPSEKREVCNVELELDVKGLVKE